MGLAFAFLRTLLAGLLFGIIFKRIKFPGGMLVGSILGAAIMNIGFNAAYVPAQAKTLAQITAGAFVGTCVNKNDILRLKKIYKPVLVSLGMYLFCMLLTGTIIYLFFPLDAATAYFSAVPGGMSDIPIISADMGASAAKVAVFQFVRMITAISFFPVMINMLCKNEKQEPADTVPGNPGGEGHGKPVINFLITISAAIIAGTLGLWTGMPAGALAFALLGVIALNLVWNKVYLPMWMKRFAQVLSGTYIGCLVSYNDLLELRSLIAPVVLIILVYSFNCFFSGWLLWRFCGLSRKVAMLVSMPAGASDMALISMDMGIKSTDLAVMQIIRLVVVCSVFPQIIGLTLWIIERM